MDIIHLLPDSVANQIAAGEVIQRPASCLKELVENSLDAGATHIKIIVCDAGRTLLQVIDDGQGMSPTDARMAFERHATSKIQSAADLFSLHTMGFRGEALASICAVAQVEVITRRADSEMGTLLEINGSNVVRQEPCQCQQGTNIKVKNLFFNVPARRRFLKTDSTELRNLIQDFFRIALVYPKVQFTFVSDDEIMFDFSAGSYKMRIEQIFQHNARKQFCEQLVDIKVNTEIVNIFGYVGKPEAAQKGNPQYFFVNGRYMKHPYFNKAVMTAYSGLLQHEQVPAYFIYFDISPSAIDVNIHPTKTEIKFADEQSIFQILLASVREALGKFNLIPSLDFNREGDIEYSAPDKAVTNLSIHADTTYNPFKTHSTNSWQPTVDHRRTDVDSNWSRLYDNATSPVAGKTKADTIVGSAAQQPTIDLKFAQSVDKEKLWQFADRYIIMPTPNGLCFIDQHRAHINIMYHLFVQQMEKAPAGSQQLLFPDTLDLSADDAVLLTEILHDLRSLGFDIEAIGPESFIINGVPSALTNQNGVRALLDIIAEIKSSGINSKQHWHEKMAWALASNVAIPYGKTLNQDEMKDIVERLLALPTPALTTKGQQVLSVLDIPTINAMFNK